MRTAYIKNTHPGYTMRHRNDDIQMGMSNEDHCRPLLESYLKTTLKKNNWNAVFDFKNENEDIWVELKSRRVNKERYPTTIITRGKLDFCSDLTKSYYIAFQFEDGLHIIKYDNELFDTFAFYTKYMRSPRYGASNNVQSVVFIPVSKLTKI